MTGKHTPQREEYRALCGKFLPTTRKEMEWRGWDALDVLLVTGDAYVDHPSFGVALIGRLLERMGLRVGVLPQPSAASPDVFGEMGRPELFIGISSGTVDSMLNNYTANKRKRSDDQYAEGGAGGHRPDYAATVYAQLARRAFPGVPIVLGGVEASLRRLAHYDYWQNKVRPSILLDSGADLLVFGMGERQTERVVSMLKQARDEAGTPVSVSHPATLRALEALHGERGIAYLSPAEKASALEPRLTLPSFYEVRDDKRKFAKTALFIEQEASPHNGRRLVQPHGKVAVVVNPPPMPFTPAELDALYELPFTRDPHPRYKKPIPAAEMIRFSITSTRGCFGGCSFCAITLHHGRIVQSRTENGILRELARVTAHPAFKGQISDIGGPTANMWRLDCKSVDIQSVCRKLSCVFPKVCAHLVTDHGPQVRLLEKARAVPKVKKISIGSGVRYDIALADSKHGREYLRALIEHHVGGQLKVAPEHLDPDVLRLMKKPGMESFGEFVGFFYAATKKAGKEQYLVPYFISGFPGCTHEQMEKVHDYLKQRNWRLQQVQAFIPTPMTLATAMYYTGIDPATKETLWVAKDFRDRKIQQALLQPEKPESREILRKSGYWQTAPSAPHGGKGGGYHRAAGGGGRGGRNAGGKRRGR